MHIHILGICGTFMGGLAALAREAGHRVTGCDTGVYPPMSDQLRGLGIALIEGYGTEQLALRKVPVAEALAMVDSGEISDAMTIMALLRLDRMRRAE